MGASLVVCLLAVAAAEPSGEAPGRIRALRERSNAAIAAHDVAAMKPLLTADYTLLPGSSGTPLGVEAMGARLQAAFDDPSFVTYVRTPMSVVVARSGKRAAETGRWLGTWRKADGEMRLTGVYQAMWTPAGDDWRLKNESFVTLRCEGSAACPSVD